MEEVSASATEVPLPKRRTRAGKRSAYSFPLEEFRPIWEHFAVTPDQPFTITFTSQKDAREVQISYYRLRRVVVEKGWHLDPLYGLPREIDSINTRITRTETGCTLTFEHANHSRLATLLRKALRKSMELNNDPCKDHRLNAKSQNRTG